MSIIEPDWSREQPRRWWDPSRQLLRSIRNYQKWKAYGGLVGAVLRRVYVLHYRFWTVVAGTDIQLDSQIAGGLILLHPNGVVIHPTASIGPNCCILQQVTITTRVKIGAHVFIGAGAKVMHEVTVGDNAKIGANAVVLCDVPAGATAVGVPARIITSSPSETVPTPEMENLSLEEMANNDATVNPKNPA